MVRTKRTILECLYQHLSLGIPADSTATPGCDGVLFRGLGSCNLSTSSEVPVSTSSLAPGYPKCWHCVLMRFSTSSALAGNLILNSICLYSISRFGLRCWLWFRCWFRLRRNERLSHLFPLFVEERLDVRCRI